jgi:two-component system invasion response regulator UvrY
MVRVLIADDHAVVRAGLRWILEENTDIVVTGEAGDGPSAIQAVADRKVDLAILDISMPGMSGLDVIKQIKSVNPNLPVLILSVHSEEQYAIRALKAGAAGYLTKESAPEELIAAIRKIGSGGKYVSQHLAEKLVDNLDANTEKPPHEHLSDREYQVLCLIASGKGVTVIAGEMGLSVKTVSTYRSRILDKLRMSSTAEIMRYAIEHRLTMD